jgi:hypothetical protein
VNSSTSGLITLASQEGSQQQQQNLEDDLLLTIFSNNNSSSNPAKKLASSSQSNIANNINNNNQQLQSTRYIPNQSICNQSMFISTILYYLKSMNLVDYHLAVLNLVKNALPSCGNSLKSLSTYIVEQLCRNLLYITNGGMSSTMGGSSAGGSSNYIFPIIAYMSSVSLNINIPDLVISMVKQLSHLLHYCLVSSASHSFALTQSIMNFYDTNSNSPSTAPIETQFKLFRQFQSDNELNQSQAKDCIIHLLPSIISSMAQVWQRCNLLLNSKNLYGINFSFSADNNIQNASNIQQQQQTSSNHQYAWILGHPSVIKQCITEMLNPIAQTHSQQFMIAIGSVWGEKRKKSRVYQEHKIIIELIRSLKSFPISVIVQNITDILKQASQNSKEKVRNFFF